MNTPHTKTKNSNSHNNDLLEPGLVASEISKADRSFDSRASVETAACPHLGTSSRSVACSANPNTQSPINPSSALVPKSALERKFRATSFAAKLTDHQRATL